MEIKDLALKKEQLPDTIEDLLPLRLIGEEKIKAYKGAIKVIDKLEMGQEQRKATLADGQDAGTALLAIEGKIGELLPAAEETRKTGSKIDAVPGENSVDQDGRIRPHSKKLPAGIDRKTAFKARQIASHPEEVAEVIKEAIANDDIPTKTAVFSKIRLKEKEERQQSSITPLMTKGKYQVIYCDPPWQYDFSGTTSRSIEDKYPTLSLEQLKALSPPIDDNAVLFMWATAPKLREALELLDAWKFEYKTNAVWDKEIIGMGYWFRGQHELLLVATKGHFSPPKENVRVSSVIRQKRTKHSKKPEIVYEIIEKCFPSMKYIELFARSKRQGWDSWGAEI